MSNDRNEFRIDWDLHELGPRQVPQAHVAHGPKDPVKLAFALAVATGAVPANARGIERRIKDKAA
jgi:hypothetical protein